MNQQTAILFFSRTAAEEANVKSFVSKKQKNKNSKVANHLIQHSFNVAKKSGLPVFSCYSPNQRGENFGEKLANAIEDIYSKGYQKVIVIGNDCPTITSKLLNKVSKQLKQDKLILGPAYDGGVYLIGLDKSIYNRNSFLNLDWLESSLQYAWKKYASEYLDTINWLKEERDIDSELDLYYYLNSSLSILINLLKELLNKVHLAPLINSFINNSILLTRNTSYKAPPLFFYN